MQINSLRNIIVLISLVMLVVVLYIYVAATIVVISINGFDAIKAYSYLPINQQFSYLFKAISSYWQFYLDNSLNINSDSYDNFSAKLFLSTFMPTIVFATAIWLLRGKLKNLFFVNKSQ